MPFKYNNQELNGQFIIGNTQYGSDWLPNSAQMDRDALGVVWEEPIYVEPPVYIPTSVTMRQARLQLAILNQYQTVNTAVASMGELAQIEWEYATTVDRTNTLTYAMVQLLGWTPEQTDAYFVAAGGL